LAAWLRAQSVADAGTRPLIYDLRLAIADWRGIESAVRLATQPQLWDYPTMTVIADSKRRVVMPGARPGDVFACEDEGNGHFLLVRLNKPSPPKKKTRAEIRKAIANSKIKFDMSWDELRQMTREP